MFYKNINDQHRQDCLKRTLSSCEELADKIKELYSLEKHNIDYETQSKKSAESFMKLFKN